MHGRLRPNAPPGRAPQEVQELARLLVAVRRGRIVEVTGPREVGGRLVRAAAARLASNFVDGVAVVELGRPHGPGAWSAFGSLGGTPFPPCGTGDPIARFAGQDMLLVVDGSEHLCPEARIRLRSLLEGSAGVRLLAAGSRPLGLDGTGGSRLRTHAMAVGRPSAR
ncbi:hypothetical protein ABZY44_29350 [Streptomyces sp. NPDC006544]|uniref:hypothetical protein n=1 Tax=Streptomyces sp. NPDC006544 TaxID=3154583 RepID=UPI00339EC89C